MPTFEVTESWYEWRTLRVEAENEEAAREAIWNGQGEVVETDSSDFEAEYGIVSTVEVGK